MSDEPVKLFPIMHSYRLNELIPKHRAAGITTLVIAIPWAMIEPHAKQAQANHSQSLQRLAERGGLGASEAMAVLEDRRWRSMDDSAAQLQLMARLFAFQFANASVEIFKCTEDATDVG